jgi:hypothetical protein
VCQPVLVTNPGGIVDMTLGSGTVYFTYNAAGGLGGVAACPMTGCSSPSEVYGPATLSPGELTLFGSELYFTATYSGSKTEIDSCATTGCSTVNLVAPGQTGAGAIAVTPAAPGAGDRVFWIVPGQITGCAQGGCPVPIVSGSINDLVTDGANLYWTDSSAGGLVRTCNPGPPSYCGGPINLATNEGTPANVAVDGANVYWINNGQGQVKQCAKGGCHAPAVLATGQTGSGIASDGTNVYWTNASAGTILRCPVGGNCGSNPTVVASNQSSPTKIAVDATAVYWSTGGSIMRVVK